MKVEQVAINTQGTDPQRATDREWTATQSMIPWLAGLIPLRGATVLEYGCGDGQVSRSLAPHVGTVKGLDIDAAAVRRGVENAERLGIDNVSLEAVPVDEIIDVFRSQSDVDIVLLYAVVEHLTIEERLAVLGAAREVARPDGWIVCIEAPNRLVSFDGHSSQLPYMNWLPFELGRLYAERSPRTDFVESLRASADAGDDALRDWWTRFGRGVSFHEFELAFEDLSRHVVAGGYDTVMLPARPLLTGETALARDLARQRPDLGPMWSRHWLDVILTPDPSDEPRTFVRPWIMDTGLSEGVTWTSWDTIAVHGPHARVRAAVGTSTTRAVLGFAAPPGESVATVMADGEHVADVPTTSPHESTVRYVDVRWSEPTDLVELRFSTSCHLSLVAFEH